MSYFQFIRSPRFQIDLSQALAAIEPLTWHAYTPKNEHWGIGLTCNVDSESPNTEALQIKQTLRPYPDSHGQESFQNFNTYSPAAEVYFKDFFNGFKLQPTKAKLSKLVPGAIIPPHKDVGCENVIRIHWVLSCERDNFFLFYRGRRRCDRLRLAAGDVFAFDPNYVHGVQYKGAQHPRIHLVANYALKLDSIEQTL